MSTMQAEAPSRQQAAPGPNLDPRQDWTTPRYGISYRRIGKYLFVIQHWKRYTHAIAVLWPEGEVIAEQKFPEAKYKGQMRDMVARAWCSDFAM